MPPSSALAYKAYEVEELVDIYFYRRLGYVVAIGGKKLQFAMPGNGWATVKFKP